MLHFFVTYSSTSFFSYSFSIYGVFLWLRGPPRIACFALYIVLQSSSNHIHIKVLRFYSCIQKWHYHIHHKSMVSIAFGSQVPDEKIKWENLSWICLHVCMLVEVCVCGHDNNVLLLRSWSMEIYIKQEFQPYITCYSPCISRITFPFSMSGMDCMDINTTWI